MQKERKKGSVVVNKYFLSLGMITAFFTLISFLVQFFYLEGSLLTEGYVIGTEFSHSAFEDFYSENYTPIIAFKAEDGNEYQFKARMSTRAPNPEESVTVLYNPTNPKDAKTWSVLDVWGSTLLLGFVSLVLLLLSIFGKTISNLFDRS